jgi:hypothetical protein
LLGVLFIGIKFAIEIQPNKTIQMDYHFSELDLGALRILFDKESAILKTKLLNGDQWHEVKEQKDKVTALSIAIHKKTRQQKSFKAAGFHLNGGEGGGQDQER